MVAVIDYNAGNVRSVLYALERIGVEAVLTADHEQIAAADKVIFPGVGAAGTTMRFLREQGLDKLICSLTQPVLGVCLGMQLLCEYSEEDNNTPCLGIIPQAVKRFQPIKGEKVPHMGWNSLDQIEAEGFIDPALQREYVYFVHSYYVELGPHTIARSDYIHPLVRPFRRIISLRLSFTPKNRARLGSAYCVIF